MDSYRRERQPVPQLTPAVQTAFNVLAGSYADKQVEQVLLPRAAEAMGEPIESLADLKKILEDPFQSLRLFLVNYAFSRRGKDKPMLLSHVNEALTTFCEQHGGVEGALEQESGDGLWEIFKSLRERDRRKLGETQNRGVLQGLMELAQETHQDTGNGALGRWAAELVELEGSIEQTFERLVDIRGVGPKNASTFLRDVVYAFDLESRVKGVDRIHIMPVDRSMRKTARLLLPEPGLEKSPDWILAGKICKYCRVANVSSIRFNMGTTYFGKKVAGDVERIEAELTKVVKAEMA